MHVTHISRCIHMAFNAIERIPRKTVITGIICRYLMHCSWLFVNKSSQYSYGSIVLFTFSTPKLRSCKFQIESFCFIGCYDTENICKRSFFSHFGYNSGEMNFYRFYTRKKASVDIWPPPNWLFNFMLFRKATRLYGLNTDTILYT